MVLSFASTGGLVGLEVGIAGGTAVVGQKLLESIFGEDAVRRMATKANDLLDMRVRRLLDGALSDQFLPLVERRRTAEDTAALRRLAPSLRSGLSGTPTTVGAPGTDTDAARSGGQHAQDPDDEDVSVVHPEEDHA